MPRYNNTITHQNLDKRIGGHCKIRKRVSSSSSSSSSVAKHYRFKRAVLVGKKVGSSTAVPTWKVIMSGSKSPMLKLKSYENGVNYSKDGSNCKGKEALSARKLGASLWEINGLRSPVDQHLLVDQHSHSPVCEKIDGSKVGAHKRRSSVNSQKLQINESTVGGFDTVSKANSIEAASYSPRDNNWGSKTRLKDVNSSLIASKELVKVLFRLVSQEEQESSKLTLVSALRVELDRVRLQVDQLIQQQRYSSCQTDALLKQFAEDKVVWKSREKERIQEAVSSIGRELEMERKLRKQAERMNKKLGTELADTRARFSKAVKELDGERRAREILEQTCDELARGIGEERVEVEELKKESEKVREEVEKERQMLQLADVLREERVQMKLAEARYEFEEKNAALERLKSELQIYFPNETSKKNGDEKNYKDLPKKTELGSIQNVTTEQSEGEVDDGEDQVSGDSELHSIELNMDNNNKSYNWSFACDGTKQTESRRASIDEVFKGRKSLSEKVQWENICLQRNTSDGIEWDFTANNKNLAVKGFDKGRSSENVAKCENNNHEDDFKRYNKHVKSQRLPSCQESASPAMSTGRSSTRLREVCSAILQDLALRREKI